jgi:hypothetical protein
MLYKTDILLRIYYTLWAGNLPAFLIIINGIYNLFARAAPNKNLYKKMGDLLNNYLII